MPTDSGVTRRSMTAKQVAEYLDCSLWSIYEMNKAGILPGRHHGLRSWRWDREAVESYAKGQKQERTTDEERIREIVDERLREVFAPLLAVLVTRQ